MSLTGHILPSVAADPGAVSARFWLQNPVLLAKIPKRMAKAQAMYDAGCYSPAELHTLAVRLQSTRNHIHATTAVEQADKKGQRELLELLDSTHITRGEAKDLRYKVFTARPSEYAWLRAPIEAAIVARAESAERSLLQVA